VSELAEWLRAQIDEDERVARACRHAHWRVIAGALTGDDGPSEPIGWTAVDSDGSVSRGSGPGRHWAHLAQGVQIHDPDGSVLDHAARQDPERALAEVKTKRLILDLHRPDVEGGHDPICNVCLYTPPCETIRALAVSYAGEPGYREEWRV
jgi:hypothetical protein